METTPINEKKPLYKRKWVWVVGVVAVLFVMGSNTNPPAPVAVAPSDQSQAEKIQESAQPQEAIKVTPNMLISEYEANGVAADAKYKGKLVEVTGTVRSIDKDILDTPYIALESSNLISSVQCMFEKGDEAKLANVKKGQSITLQGNLSGKLGNVIVRDCVIVN